MAKDLVTVIIRMTTAVITKETGLFFNSEDCNCTTATVKIIRTVMVVEITIELYRYIGHMRNRVNY